ncbi:hypothetical protein GGG16DRAFT_117644 [Schizophyllum commune]
MEMRGWETRQPMHFLTGSPALKNLDVQYFNTDAEYPWLTSMRFPQLPGLTSLSLEVHAVVSRAALLEALDACAHTLVDLSMHLRCSSSALRSMNPIHFDVLRDLALGDAA